MTVTSDQLTVTSDQRFQFALTEYGEVCHNVRESWNYIVALLRYYLFLQVLLLSLVGFVYSAITTAATEFTGTVSFDGRLVQNGDSAPAKIAVQEKEALTREVRMKRLVRFGAIIALVLVGGGLSLGAFHQSHRLFVNAAAFVQRAAAIETEYGTPSTVLSETALQTHVYMLQRLNDKNLFKMEKALSATYMTGLVLWIIMAALLVFPVIIGV